jgi:AraC-like DNA-binding protein
MNNRPLQVFCGNINTAESSVTCPDFSCMEICDHISVVTYTYTGVNSGNTLLKPVENPTENNLVIQVFKTKNPFIGNAVNKTFVNVAFILKNINLILGNESLSMGDTEKGIFNPESITQIILPELVTSHLAMLEIRAEQESIKQIQIRGWAYQLAFAITETVSSHTIPQTLHKFKQSDIQKIRNLGYSLKSNLQKTSPSLEEMAKTVDMSPTKFKTMFKEVLGVSPHQYILNLKLNHAQYLLKHQSLSISEVAYKVGFNHPSALTRLFQKKLGICPNEI